MQTLWMTLFLLTLGVTGFSQNEKNLFPRTITVTGSAEREIIPDEIYVRVDLKEYESKGQGKISLDQIKKNFLTQLKTLGIPDSLVSIAAYEGYNANPWYKKKHKKEELYASIAYQVKLQNSRQLDGLVDHLDDNATQNFFIQKTSFSGLETLKRQLKIEAVMDARMKAAYLAGAVNEKVGLAITIHEPTEYGTPYETPYRMAGKALEEVAAADAPTLPVDFKKIRIKYEVTIVFALD